MPAGAAFASFLEVIETWDSGAPTACAGWTVHDLLAHVTAGSAEIADLAELVLRGEPARPTRGFEEREAPYRALSPADLRGQFVDEAIRTSAAFHELTATDRLLPFTGAELTPASVMTHARAELVIHRWDIVGDDDTSIQALSAVELLHHTITVVGSMQPRVLPSPLVAGGELKRPVVLRADGQPDVLIDGPTLALATDASAEVIDLHPAARLLALWGRTPTADIG